jgi:hypothetical protein
VQIGVSIAHLIVRNRAFAHEIRLPRSDELSQVPDSDGSLLPVAENHCGNIILILIGRHFMRNSPAFPKPSLAGKSVNPKHHRRNQSVANAVSDTFLEGRDFAPRPHAGGRINRVERMPRCCAKNLNLHLGNWRRLPPPSENRESP